MRKLLLMLVLSTSVICHAQNVAINNDASLPDNSAILDIKSGTKGLLIPRMNTAAIAAIVNPAKGLLVLDTVKNQLLVNMGTPTSPNWQTIVASSGWSLAGNAGIDQNSQFIGTLDTKPFIIRVNNVRSGYLDTLTQNVSYGFRSLDSITSGIGNTAIGYKSLVATKEGYYNTGVGFNSLRNNSSGNNNTGIGINSLYNNQTGYSNVAIGTYALFRNVNLNNLVAIGDSALYNNGFGATGESAGEDNTAVGSKAMYLNTRGYYNTALGSNTMRSNTLGSQNVAVGTRSLVANTTGSQNVAVGTNSLSENTIGSSNTSTGYSSMRSNTSGRYNSTYGEFSLNQNSTGESNSAFGARSMRLNTTGSTNTAMGFSSLVNNETGYSNVAIGAYALLNSENLSNLVAIGDSALYKNGQGTANTAIGSKTLFENTSGNNNTATGFLAMNKNTGGGNNTATGYSALVTNSTGHQNTATGSSSLFANTIGQANTAMGYGSNYYNTTGSSNSSFGVNSMPSNINGNSNSAFGETTLLWNTSGSNNTAIGYYTLEDNMDGSDNTALGSYSDVTQGNLTNATAIGTRALVGCSNCMVLGSISNVNNATSNVNVGIGTTTPDAPLTFGNITGKKITLYSSSSNSYYGMGIQGGLLQIHTDASGADIAFGYGSSASFTERMRIKGNGFVGIGTSTPANQFEVVGPASVTPVTLVIGNRNAFGAAAMEFVSDYGLANQWRPGYIRSNDGGVGGFIGSLEFYTNGAGIANKYGSLKGFEVRNGIAYTATGTVSSFSDARLKNNITAFTDGLNVIGKINPVQFYYNADAPFNTDHQQVGVIAQDLEKLAPYMIEKNRQNGYDDLRSVNNQAYTFLLINAVKEQQQQIEKQQSQIKTSNDKVEKLNQEVAELKRMMEQLLKK